MGYIQGINLIAGCFLYNMPEIFSYFALYNLFNLKCPRYCGDGSGSSDGDYLVVEIIKVIDPTLYEKLKNEKISIFTHPIIHSLLTASPPLNEVFKLWDLMLAFQIQMIIFYTVSMILLERDNILCVHAS